MNKCFVILILFAFLIPTFGQSNNESEWLRQTRYNLESVTNFSHDYRINFFHDCGARALAAALLIHEKSFSFRDIENDLEVWEKGTDLVQLEKCHPNTAFRNRSGRPAKSELFAKITAPTLILKADAQGKIRRQNEEVTKLLKNGRIVHIEGARHNVRRDQKERLLKALKAFLREL